MRFRRCEKGNPAVRRVYAKLMDLLKGGRAAAAICWLSLFATALVAFLVVSLAVYAML